MSRLFNAPRTAALRTALLVTDELFLLGLVGDPAAAGRRHRCGLAPTLSLVESGVGYTILSYSCVHHLISAGRIRKWSIVNPAMTRSLVVAPSSQRPVTKAARALVDLIGKQMAKLVADDGGRGSG